MYITLHPPNPYIGASRSLYEPLIKICKSQYLSKMHCNLKISICSKKNSFCVTTNVETILFMYRFLRAGSSSNVSDTSDDDDDRLVIDLTPPRNVYFIRLEFMHSTL